METISLQPGQQPDSPETAVALGFFDGVHSGHRTLLAETVRLAQKRNLVPAVFTFAGGMPGIKTGGRLTTDEERAALLAEAGIRLLFTVPFANVRDTSPEDFVRTLQTVCRARMAVCGFNFRFGAGAAGDGEALRRLMVGGGGAAQILPPSRWLGEPVSSSRIRYALEAGQPEAAAAMLGRPYALSSPVIHGKSVGRRLGAPTLNQRFPPEKVIPAHGVYVCRCHLGDTVCPGVCNVGVRPTLETAAAVNCETYLLDFSGDVYGLPVQTELLAFLRSEQVFPSPEALAEQIRQDAAAARAWFDRAGTL